MRRLLPVIGVVVLMTSLTSCSKSTPGSGPLLLSVSGEAFVNDGVADFRVTAERRLPLGSLVEVLDGTAEVTYPDGTVLALRTALNPTVGDSRVLLGDEPVLERGEVLVQGEGERAVEAGNGTVLVTGASKVSRKITMSASVYQGQTALESDGRSLTVLAYHQAAVPGRRLVPDRADPLRTDPVDPWDQQFLGEAIQLSTELEAASAGFTRTLRPGTVVGPGLYRSLLAGLENEPSFSPALFDAARTPGEWLIGAAVALSSSSVDGFVGRWSSAFAFRDQGASWGLVAVSTGADSARLRELVRSALRAAPLVGPVAGGAGDGPSITSPTTSPALSSSTTNTTQPNQQTTTTTNENPNTIITLPPLPLDQLIDLLGGGTSNISSDGGLLGALGLLGARG